MRWAPPVFAAGISHLGPYRDGPGELRGTVAVAGLAVSDGDLVVADEDGIAVILRARCDELLAAAEAKRAAEEEESLAIAPGAWDRSWLGAPLRLQEVPLP